MKHTEVIEHLRTERYGTILCLGVHDFTPGFNAFYAVVPKRGADIRGGTTQWHRDIIPALKRFVRARTGQTLMNIITSTDGIVDQEALNFLRHRAIGGNDRLWAIFTWDLVSVGQPKGTFWEVSFDAR